MLQFLIGISILFFPPAVFNGFTDPLIIKPLIFGFTGSIVIIISGLKIIVKNHKINLFNKKLIILSLFVLLLLISAFFSANRYDSLVSWSWYFCAFLFFYSIVLSYPNPDLSRLNRDLIGTGKQSLIFFRRCFLAGILFAGLIQIFTTFSLHTLSLHERSFTPLGSLIDHAVILLSALPILIYELRIMNCHSETIRQVHGEKSQILSSSGLTRGSIFSFWIYPKGTCYFVAALAFAGMTYLLSLLSALFQLFTVSKPVILPFSFGINIAGRILLQNGANQIINLLFGSGIGTFAADFTRFKPLEINSTNLWNSTFTTSSSFFIELIATTGILGAMAYLFIGGLIIKNIIKDKKNVFSWGGFIIFFSSIFLPLSFTSIGMLFILLALSGISNNVIYDPHGISGRRLEEISPLAGRLQNEKMDPRVKPEDDIFFYGNYIRQNYFIPFSIFCILCSIIVSIYLVLYSFADILFKKSLLASQNNNGIQTYQYLKQAIKIYPYRDSFYRSFSQTNYSFSILLSGKASEKDVRTLFIQALSSAKKATELSPLTVVNWQNLASIYRNNNLLDTNAEAFAITTSQQALLLNPNNPEEYINLGGIYYQLNKWDDAITEFSKAINLRPDFINAYYNRGHAYEQKGNINKALEDYKIVLNLTKNNPVLKAQIENDINNAEKRL